VRKSDQDVAKPSPARLRCAIYTRKSTEEGLEQEFNSLDAQREAAESFIQSQRREGWIALSEPYDPRPGNAKILAGALHAHHYYRKYSGILLEGRAGTQKETLCPPRTAHYRMGEAT
jgi:hypothetical protein